MIHRLSEVRDEAGNLTHKMCCLCFDYIVVEDLWLGHVRGLWRDRERSGMENAVGETPVFDELVDEFGGDPHQPVAPTRWDLLHLGDVVVRA